MNKKEFDKFLQRDQYCLHCGVQDDTLVPQHRRNRGIGGSVSRSKPSNVIVVCSLANGLFEASEAHSVTAQAYGWKLRAGETPEWAPVYDAYAGVWYVLDDEYGRIEVAEENPTQVKER